MHTWFPLPNADNADPNVPAALLQVHNHEADEIQEHIRSMRGGDTVSNTEDYIYDVVIDYVVSTSQIAIDFLAGLIDNDNEIRTPRHISTD